MRFGEFVHWPSLLRKHMQIFLAPPPDHQEPTEVTRNRQERSRATRSHQEPPGATRSDQKRPGTARNHHEPPGATRSRGATRNDPEPANRNHRHPEPPEATRSHQEPPEATRRHQEAPGATRSHQELPEVHWSLRTAFVFNRQNRFIIRMRRKMYDLLLGKTAMGQEPCHEPPKVHMNSYVPSR